MTSLHQSFYLIYLVKSFQVGSFIQLYNHRRFEEGSLWTLSLILVMAGLKEGMGPWLRILWIP